MRIPEVGIEPAGNLRCKEVLRRFPPQTRYLNHSGEEIKMTTGCGYRAKQFHDLAQKAVEHPEFFLETGWRSIRPEEFYNQIITIPGIGHVNATYLCRFYGCLHGYTIDRWIMKRCEELWNPGLNGSSKKYSEWAERQFGDFAPYGPNLLWFSITKYRHEFDGPFRGKRWDI
jgi:hypothetical protein